MKNLTLTIVALFCLHVGEGVAQNKTVWEIGKADNKSDGMALAPSVTPRQIPTGHMYCLGRVTAGEVQDQPLVSVRIMPTYCSDCRSCLRRATGSLP
jgi:hypothetical protein